MPTQMLKRLYQYDSWANHRIFEALANLSEQELDQSTGRAGLGNIRDTAAHIVAAQELWYTRWLGHSPSSIKGAKDYGTLDQMLAESTRLNLAIQSLLDQLSPSDLAKSWPYTSTDGKLHVTPLWTQMIHLVNHGTDHRSQLCTMLSLLGYSAPVLDMIVFFREHPAV